MTRARTGHPAATLMQHLVGMHFPAEKRALLRQARQSGACQDVMDALECIPDHPFQTAAEVLLAVGEAEHRGDGAER